MSARTPATLLLSIVLWSFFVFGFHDAVATTNIGLKFPGKHNQEPKCTDCHNSLIEGKVPHPIATSSCETCHQVNIQDHTEKGVKGLQLTSALPSLCYTCHEGTKNLVDSGFSKHAALDAPKKCTACHSPHSSSESKLLLKEEKTLCLSCHNRDQINGKNVVNIEKLLAKSKNIHSPVEGGCLGCHNPHASKNPFLLVKKFPGGAYAESISNDFALCWGCHDPELGNKTNTSTGFRDKSKNLHYLHVKGNKGRSCTLCHNVHAADNNHLIANKIQFGKWNMPLQYVAKENGGSCLPACHGLKEYSR